MDRALEIALRHYGSPLELYKSRVKDLIMLLDYLESHKDELESQVVVASQETEIVFDTFSDVV